jgi:hypothetical protein
VRSSSNLWPFKCKVEAAGPNFRYVSLHKAPLGERCTVDRGILRCCAFSPPPSRPPPLCLPHCAPFPPCVGPHHAPAAFASASQCVLLVPGGTPTPTVSVL